ncbi:MAG TPA: hypothetical protein VF623_04515 [Segetibacter sp.]|jgi:hypothetical protein
MNTVTLEIINKRALSLLKELEKLNLIKIQSKDNNVSPTISLSQKFAGKLSSKTGELLDKHIDNSRNEWQRNT